MIGPENPDEKAVPLTSPVDQSSAEADNGAATAMGDIVIHDAEGLEDQPVAEAVLLDLQDLLPDASGEVVLFADEELPLNILAHEVMTDVGIAETHITATGVDVTGHHYYSFESGITLYSPTDLLIVSDSGTS